MAYPSKCFDEEIVLKADLEAAGSELLALPSSLKKLSDLLEARSSPICNIRHKDDNDFSHRRKGRDLFGTSNFSP